MKILLLSAYHAQSHKQWCDGLVSHFDEHSWDVLSLPPRYFNWHMRGNALIWSKTQQETFANAYDLIIATSMVDLHGLRGFIPRITNISTLLYFHENQFDYPQFADKRGQIELQLVSFYSAICADKVIFNSSYNYQSFISGLRELLNKLPDYVPSGLIEEIESKSRVLSVPIDDACYSTQIKSNQKLNIIWNHRWEYDKWPENFFLALLKLKEMNLDFDLHVLGQQFRNQPAVFAEMEQLLSENIRSWGYIGDKEAYRQILRHADVVVSTALHDFQGLAVLEAVACGCVPLVPDRLAYPQFFHDKYLYPSLTNDNEAQAEYLADYLARLIEDFNKQCLIDPPILSDLSWSQMKSEYASIINDEK